MPADPLLTAADLRRALDALDTAVVSRTLARERAPLADLAQLVALAAPGDRARRQAVLTALATGLRALGGEVWRGLVGQEAIELVRRAMDAAGGDGMNITERADEVGEFRRLTLRAVDLFGGMAYS